MTITPPTPRQWPEICSPHQMPEFDTGMCIFSPVRVQLTDGRHGTVIAASVVRTPNDVQVGTAVVKVDGVSSPDFGKVFIEDVRTLTILPAAWPTEDLSALI